VGIIVGLGIVVNLSFAESPSLFDRCKTQLSLHQAVGGPHANATQGALGGICGGGGGGDSGGPGGQP
jgi:hypothetical protein